MVIVFASERCAKAKCCIFWLNFKVACLKKPKTIF